MQDIPKKLRSGLEAVQRRLPSALAQRIQMLLADTTNFQNLGLWAAAIVSAFLSVAYARLFRFAEEAFASLRGQNPAWAFLVGPLFFLLAWLFVRNFSPEASGSGIPQIMAANEMDYSGSQRGAVDRLLSLRTAWIKILSSLLCVLGGGAVGREGPTLQISASVFHFFGVQVRRFVPNTREHVWVVAGAAAGLAAAFNTPLGGIVYAIEELGLVHFHQIRTALISGVIVAGLVAQWLLGSYLYLGLPSLTPVGMSMIPVALATGALTGAAGALFGRVLFALVRRRQSLSKTSQLALVTLACGLIAGALNFADARASGTGVKVITGLLFNNEESGWILMTIRYVGTMAAYLSGAAGGIFSPSLAAGATIGSYLTQFLAPDHPHLMVLLGMIGFLTGVTRTPFTSFILVLEMTDRHSAIFPMMVAALAGHWFSRLIDEVSFYEHVKERFLVRDTAASIA